MSEYSNNDIVILSKIVSQCKNIDKANQFFDFNKALFFNETEGIVYRNSVFMPILQIGELVGHLSEDFKNSVKSVPWHHIRKMRNIFAHNYEQIDYQMAWDTVTGDIYTIDNLFSSIIETRFSDTDLSDSEKLQIKLAIMAEWAEKAIEKADTDKMKEQQKDPLL